MYKTRYQPVWKSFFVWLFGDLSFLVFAGGLTWFFYQPGRGYILLFDGAMITIFLYFFCHTAYVHLTTLYVDDYVISVDKPFFSHLTLGWSELEDVVLQRRRFLFFRPTHFLVLTASSKTIFFITSTLTTTEEEKLLAFIGKRLKPLVKKDSPRF